MQLRNHFNAVEARFVTPECRIIQFGYTPTRRDLIAPCQSSGVMRDLGPTTTTPPPAPTNP